MINWLRKPYPSIIQDGYSKAIVIDIVISLMVFFILYGFQPQLFFRDKTEYSLSISLLYSAITLCTTLFYTYVSAKMLPKFFNIQNWTIGKEIVFITTVVLSIAIANYLIGKQIISPESGYSIKNFTFTVASTLIIAIFPVTTVIFFYSYHNQKKAITGSNELNKLLSKAIESQKEIETETLTPNTESSLIILGEGKYETIEVKPSQLIYIESTGNYSDIYYITDSTINKRTFRTTLQNLQNQLGTQEFFFRSHRSYIVNTKLVLQANGNAQGYQLSIKHLEDKTIPVSRSKIAAFNEIYDR